MAAEPVGWAVPVAVAVGVAEAVALAEWLADADADPDADADADGDGERPGGGLDRDGDGEAVGAITAVPKGAQYAVVPRAIRSTPVRATLACDTEMVSVRRTMPPATVSTGNVRIRAPGVAHVPL